MLTKYGNEIGSYMVIRSGYYFIYTFSDARLNLLLLKLSVGKLIFKIGVA